MKKRKILLIVSSLVNILIGLFFVFGSVMLIKNIGGFADEMKRQFLEMYGTEKAAVEALNLSGEYLIISSVINFVFAFIYLAFAFLKTDKYLKYKVWLVLSSIINMFLGMNFVSMVLVMIVILSREQSPVIQMVMQPDGQVFINGMQINPEEFKSQMKMKNTTDQISVIKKMKEDGTITEEEYKKQLDKIISDSVNDNTNK